MGQSISQGLQLEREKILWNLSNGKNRAKMLVRLMDIDEELEKFTQLEKQELGATGRGLPL